MASKEKVDLFVAFSVILLAAVFIGYQSFFPLEQENPQEITELIIGEEKYIPVHKEEVLPTLSIPKPYQERKPKASFQKHQNLNDLSTTVITAKLINTEAEITPTATTLPAKIDSIVKIVEKNVPAVTLEAPDSIVDTTILRNEASDISEDEPAPVTSESAKPLDKSCVILIGAFSEEVNKTNLLSTLKSAGYDIFEAPFKNLTRIGIYYDCNAPDLEERIATFRKKYAPDVVLLRRE